MRHQTKEDCIEMSSQSLCRSGILPGAFNCGFCSMKQLSSISTPSLPVSLSQGVLPLLISGDIMKKVANRLRRGLEPVSLHVVLN